MKAYFKAHTYINQSWYELKLIGYDHIVYLNIQYVKFNKLFFYYLSFFWRFLYYNNI